MAWMSTLLLLAWGGGTGRGGGGLLVRGLGESAVPGGAMRTLTSSMK